MPPRARCCGRGGHGAPPTRRPTLHEAAARVFVNDAAAARRSRGARARWRRWRRATRCARCWPRSAGCSSRHRSTPSRCGAQLADAGGRAGQVYPSGSMSSLRSSQRRRLLRASCWSLARCAACSSGPCAAGRRRRRQLQAIDAQAYLKTAELRFREGPRTRPIPRRQARHAAAAALLPARSRPTPSRRR